MVAARFIPFVRAAFYMEVVLAKVKEIRRQYSFCKSLVYAIQSITGDKTHDILARLVQEADQAIIDYEVDLEERRSLSWFDAASAKKYFYYPGTKLYLGAYVIVRTAQDYYGGKYYNKVSYSFKLPQSYVNMDDKAYDDVAVDGLLTDSSFDFDKPTLKNAKTPKEKRDEANAKAELAKAKREAKKIP